MTDMTPELVQFEEWVNSSPDKFDLSLTHHHLSGEADLYYLNRDTNIAFLAFRATLSANGGEAVAWQFYQDGKWWNGDDSIKDHRANTEAAGIPIRELFTAPPSVAVPEKANHADYGYIASRERPWFFYSPGGDGMVFAATEAEARAGAEKEVADSLEDDVWSEYVDQICYGIITHTATQVDQEYRPATLDGGVAEDGSYWPDDCDFKCNIKLLPLSDTTPVAVPEVTHEMISAALGSNARDDDGEFPFLLDLLDFSGENKARVVVRAALVAALSAAPQPQGGGE